MQTTFPSTKREVGKNWPRWDLNWCMHAFDTGWKTLTLDHLDSRFIILWSETTMTRISKLEVKIEICHPHMIHSTCRYKIIA
jgi:hypothetical protein